MSILENDFKNTKKLDLIIGSDLIYDDTTTLLLFETLNILFEINQKTICILAYTLHKPSDIKFIEIAENLSLIN